MVVQGALIADMSLEGHNYRIDSASGNISVIGGRIYFYNGPCDGVGQYQWTIHRGILHFTLIDDACGRTMDLANRNYTKA